MVILVYIALTIQAALGGQDQTPDTFAQLEDSRFDRNYLTWWSLERTLSLEQALSIDMKNAKTQCAKEKAEHLLSSDYQAAVEQAAEDARALSVARGRTVDPLKVISNQRRICCYKIFGVPVHPFWAAHPTDYAIGKHRDEVTTAKNLAKDEALSKFEESQKAQNHRLTVAEIQEARDQINSHIEHLTLPEIYYDGYLNFHKNTDNDKIRALVDTCTGGG